MDHGGVVCRFAILALLLLSVRCDVEEDNLLQGINSFRKASSNATALVKNDNANCVADEIADRLEDTPCGTDAQSRINSDYQNVLRKCKVDANSTAQGLVLPVCVPKRVATLVLSNYTNTRNARYLNDTTYSGAGIGTEDDWTVLVLTTSTPGGTFANGGRFLEVVAMTYYLPSLLFMLFLALVY